MPAALYLLRLESPPRWRGLLALAIVMGLAGAIVVAMCVGAARTSSAVERLDAVSNTSDSFLISGGGTTPTTDNVRRIPGVQNALSGPFTQIAIEGVSKPFLTLIVDNPDYGRTIEKGPIARGRLFEPSASDEIVVDERFAMDNDVHVGDTLTGLLATKAETIASAGGQQQVKPTGPRVPLRIVGVQRTPLLSLDDEGNGGDIVTSPGFLAKYRDLLTVGGKAPGYSLVWLKPGVDPKVFDAAAVKAGYFPNAESSSAAVGTAVHLQANALGVAGLVLILAVLLVVGLTTTREVRALTADTEPLAPLGVSRRTRCVVAVLHVALAAAVGVAIAVLGAWALSRFFPVGQATTIDPEPGTQFSAGILGGGALLAAVVLLVAWVSSLRAVSRSGRRSSRTTGLALQFRPSTAMALKALRLRSAGRSSLTLLWAACAVAVFGIVASLVVSSGIDTVRADSRTYGQVADAFVTLTGDDAVPVDADAVLRTVRTDRDVQRAWDIQAGRVTIGGEQLVVLAPKELNEAGPRVVLAGRLPNAPDEIAIAPKSMERSHLHIGDTVALKSPTGTHRQRIVGSVLVDTEGGVAFDDGSVVSGSAFTRLFADDASYRYAMLQLKDPAQTDAWITRVNADSHLSAYTLSSAAGAITQLRGTPRLLALLLALLCAIAFGFGLFSYARSARGDQAIFRSLGGTRAQSAGVIPQSAAGSVLLMSCVFAPLGAIVGRLTWRAFCESQHLLFIAPPTAGIVLVVVVAAVVLALVMSIAPSIALARTSTSRALRRE